MDVKVLELPGQIQVAVLDGIMLVDPSVPAETRVLLVRALADLKAAQDPEELERIIEFVYSASGAEVKGP